MATATWKVYVDWDGSGSFTDVARKDLNGDHTSTTEPRKVKSINISRGKSGDFQRYVASQAQIVVSNPLGYFDPESPGAVATDGSVLGVRTTLANNQPAVDADRFFATPTAAGQAYAQSFFNGATRMVDRIDLRMKRTGNPGGGVLATIYTNSSNLPSAKKDNYSTSRGVTISTIGTSYEWVMFTFERPVILLAGVTYHILVNTSGYTRSAGVNELSWGYNTTDYAGGRPSTYNGTTWSNLTTTQDFKFRVTSNDVQIGRRCWIVATYSGTDYPLFYGRLKAVQPKVGADAQEATLLFEDLFAEWAEKEITLTMATNRIVADQTVNSAVTDVLKDMGFTSTNWSVGDEDEVIPYLFFNRMNGQQALEELTSAFCGFHFLKPAPAGTHWKYIWRSRHYEYNAAIEETWNRSLYQDMTVEHPLEHQDVYNRVTASGNPRKPGAVATLWEYGVLNERWSANEARTIQADYTDPAASVTTMVAGTDYPTGWTISGFAAYATHAVLTVTAPATASVLTKLQIRGVPVTAQPQVSATENDTETQSAYAVMYGGDGILIGPNMDSDFHQSYGAAQRYARTMVDRNKRKFPDLVVTRSNRSGYPSILSREVGDVVTVTSGTIGTSSRVNIGVNGTYMIESIEHEISDGGFVHFAKYRLRKLGVVSNRLWVLGTADLGATTIPAP